MVRRGINDGAVLRDGFFVLARGDDDDGVIADGNSSFVLSFYSFHIVALTEMKKPNLN
jgi:hypothetical protein